MPSFLLECFSEEIPARMQAGAAQALARAFEEGLKKADIAHGAVTSYVSPRHLAVHVAGLPDILADRVEEKKGPKTNAPEAAIAGFLNAAGTTREACEERVIGKDTYLFARTVIKGGKVADVLKHLSEAVLKDFTWPKSMRWGAHHCQWVRPLHRLVALFDADILPVTFHHLTASNLTEGHRFLSPDAIEIPHADRYVETLESAHVLVDANKRRALVQEQIAQIASSLHLQVVEDAGLVSEITGLVEYPHAYASMFDADFLKLPKEVLISEMKHHQRYVSLVNEAGELQPHFIIISNMNKKEAAHAIASGNARVLRARLSDGAFYYETDKAKKLEDWGLGLHDVVFHAKVGMMNEKVARIEAIALNIAAHLAEGGVKDMPKAALIAEAAKLCKADLTTGMVGEFPELQGIMGRYYAVAQGVNTAIAEAIYEHYKPSGAGDSLPETALGALISIADKLDSITSLWAAGEKPTGSKDPLALRRAAIGILRVLDARGWALNLSVFFPGQHEEELLRFFTDRMKHALKDEGIRHDIIDAVLEQHHGQCVPYALFTRVRSFAEWLKTDAGEKTTAAIRRAQNIVAAEEKKEGAVFDFAAANAALLAEPAETSLHQTLARHFQQSPATELDGLAELAAPIEAFFDAVLVNAENADLRRARLGLLVGATTLAKRYADFSKLEG